MKKETTTSKWNVLITENVRCLGGEKSNRVGFYIVNKKEIDLTASGTSIWQVAKNIINQLGA